MSDHRDLSGKESLERQRSHNEVKDSEEENGKEASDSSFEYVTGVKLGILMASVTMVVFLMMLDLSIVSTAVPRITSQFQSLKDVGWYGSAYLLANCSLQPLSGKIYTHFDSKGTFIAFLALFELGSLLCGVANSSKMLIVGRAVAGMGGSGLANGALTIISASVPLAKNPAYLGIVMSVSQIGTVLGPLVGGSLTQYTTWRWCFYINLPIGGAVACPLLFIKIPHRNAKSDATVAERLKKLDTLGFILFAAAAIQLLLALQWGGNDYRWDSSTIIGLFCGSFGVFCVFLFWEYRKGDSAMIPFAIVRQRAVWSGCLVMLFFLGSMFITTYYLPIYFQAVRDASPTDSGVYLLPAIISQIIFAAVSGILVSKLGYYLPWSVSSAILTSIGTGLLSTLTPSTSTAKWIGYQILAGSGRGMGLQMPLVAVQNYLHQSEVPIGIAILIFFNTFGGALFLSFGQLTFTHGLSEYIPIFAPGVNTQQVIEAGAGAIRKTVPKDSLAGVLEAYNKSVNHTFFLATACAAMTFVFCWGLGWKSVKKPVKVEPKA